MAARRRQAEGRLMARTRELLKASDKAYDDIFKATDIPANWLHRFASGRVDDPGVNRVETLYTFLSGNPLQV